MKKLTLLTLFLFQLILTNCEVFDQNKTKEEELSELIAQKEYILSLVSSATCFSNGQCDYIGFGSKPCGGPWSYLVYPTSMDTRLLFEQVAIYNLKEHQYNQKWNIVSDCMFVLPPVRVDCINNKCVAIYNN